VLKNEAAKKTRGPAYWLIAKHENGRMHALVTGARSDDQTLPVFSFEEEARLFLWLENPGTDWRARETTAGEIISVLHGPYLGVNKVALDPLPSIFGEEINSLVSLRDDDFARILVGQERLRYDSRA
jgi:hypothetical protein